MKGSLSCRGCWHVIQVYKTGDLGALPSVSVASITGYHPEVLSRVSQRADLWMVRLSTELGSKGKSLKAITRGGGGFKMTSYLRTDLETCMEDDMVVGLVKFWR